MESGHAAEEQQMAEAHTAAETARALANAAEMELLKQGHDDAERQLKEENELELD